MGVHLALLAVSLCFGMHYFWGKVVVGALPDAGWPVLWSAIRAGSAAVVLMGTALALGRWRLPARDLPKVAVLAVFGVIVNQVLFIQGLRETTPTESALVNNFIPVATLGIGLLLGQERPHPRRILGILLAIGGVLWLLLPGASGHPLHWRGNALCFANSISFALFLVLSRRFLRTRDAMASTAWLFVFGGIGINLLAIPAWGRVPLAAVEPRVWAHGACIVVFATVVTFFLNNWALRRAEASQVALYIYLQPLVAASAAALWLGTRPGAELLGPAALIFLGVALGTLGRKPATG